MGVELGKELAVALQPISKARKAPLAAFNQVGGLFARLVRFASNSVPPEHEHPRAFLWKYPRGRGIATMPRGEQPPFCEIFVENFSRPRQHRAAVTMTSPCTPALQACFAVARAGVSPFGTRLAQTAFISKVAISASQICVEGCGSCRSRSCKIGQPRPDRCGSDRRPVARLPT